MAFTQINVYQCDDCGALVFAGSAPSECGQHETFECSVCHQSTAIQKGPSLASLPNPFVCEGCQQQ